MQAVAYDVQQHVLEDVFFFFILKDTVETQLSQK